ncbi:MAG: hypothetical protein LC637_05455 [Xanthomonadaceae bacterium]|nr:hypothetical protein [Xanthomonadaceae bacterium]
MWAPRHPFFEHACACAWLAWRDGQAVGRISAQVDGLHAAAGFDDIGQFGQLESVDDAAVFEALLQTAGDWLTTKGKTVLQGPFDLSINQQCGLLVDGYSVPSMMMMPYNPPFYSKRLEQLGFESAVELLAYRGTPDYQTPTTVSRLLKRMGKRLRIETVKRADLSAQADRMREIFNDAWSQNWGFVPLTESEFKHMVSEMKMLVRPGYVHLAWLDEQPAGFIVALPDLNELTAGLDGRLLPFGGLRLLWRIWRKRNRGARIPLMGIVRRHHQSLAGAAVSYALFEAARGPLIADGVELCEQSWILEQNQGMRAMLESIGMQVAQRFRIYQKPLPA